MERDQELFWFDRPAYKNWLYVGYAVCAFQMILKFTLDYLLGA